MSNHVTLTLITPGHTQTPCPAALLSTHFVSFGTTMFSFRPLKMWPFFWHTLLDISRKLFLPLVTMATLVGFRFHKSQITDEESHGVSLPSD